MFMQDYWYAVCWAREIGKTDTKPFARTICGHDIVFYRKQDGTLVALHDQCPHRLVPLSLGIVENDKLRCGYHGLLFSGDGKCVEMPNQENIPKTVCTKAYPVAEKHRFVWVWIGNSEQADVSTIPDVHWMDNAEWAGDGGTLHIKANYQLILDNLMDLSHEAYVHSSSIGQEELFESPIKTEVEGDVVRVTRWMRDVGAPPFWRMLSGFGEDQRCDRWQIVEYTPPANILIDVGVAKTGTGAPEGDRSQGVTGMVIDLITPETEKTSFYHWGFSRNFDVDRQDSSPSIAKAQKGVFLEDVDIFESQQVALDKMDNPRMMNFNIDAGGVRVRQFIDKKLRAQDA